MTVHVDIDVDWNDIAFKKQVKTAMGRAAKATATSVYNSAKATSLFKDDTGNLRKSISKFKSRYPDGGWIVIAKAPHSGLIEFGCRGGAQKPRPFMRTSLKKNRSKALKNIESELKKITER